MAKKIPDVLLELLQKGEQLTREYEEQTEREWNETLEKIGKDWDEIERQVKAILPPEVRDYAHVGRPDINQYKSYTLTHAATRADVAELEKRRPPITVFGQYVELRIPRMHTIYVEVSKGETDSPNLRYSVKDWYSSGKIDSDGSIEMALYQAKRSYDNDTHPHPEDYER